MVLCFHAPALRYNRKIFVAGDFMKETQERKRNVEIIKLKHISLIQKIDPFLFSSPSEAALACLSVDPAMMLMVVGVLMFILTFCGCVGSLRENICLLQTVSQKLSITRLWYTLS